MRANARAKGASRKKSHRQRQYEKGNNSQGNSVGRVTEGQRNILDRTDRTNTSLPIKPKVQKGKNRQGDEPIARTLLVNDPGRYSQAPSQHHDVKIMKSQCTCCWSGCGRQLMPSLKFRRRKPLLPKRAG